MSIIIDIETVRAELTDEELAGIRATIKPRSNLVDPAKIEADIEKKYQTFLDGMALDPFYNKIVCICARLYNRQAEWHGQELVSVALPAQDETEEGMLTHFMALLRDCPAPKSYPWVGVNVSNFDLPTIALHLAKYQIETDIMLMPSRYNRHQVIDLMTIFGERWKSLNSLADYLGIDRPDDPINGSMVQECYDKDQIEKIAMHCQSDVQTTWHVYDRIYNLLTDWRQ